MNACDVIQEELPGYAAERLSSAERARIAMHLRTCTGCQAELASLQRLERLLDAALPIVPASVTLRSAFANRLAAEIEAEEADAVKRQGFIGWLTRPWLVPAVASAAVAVVVLVQSLGQMEDTPSTPTEVASAPQKVEPVVAEKAEPVAEVAKVEKAAEPMEVASAGEPKEPDLGVPPEVASDPELFVDFDIIRELDTLVDGSQESAG